jgi:hypothetical protein
MEGFDRPSNRLIIIGSLCHIFLLDMSGSLDLASLYPAFGALTSYLTISLETRKQVVTPR